MHSFPDLIDNLYPLDIKIFTEVHFLRLLGVPTSNLPFQMIIRNGFFSFISYLF